MILMSLKALAPQITELGTIPVGNPMHAIRISDGFVHQGTEDKSR